VRGLWRVLRTQWWVILLCLVVGGGAAVGYSKLQRPRYQAQRAVDLPVLIGSAGASGGAGTSGAASLGSGASQLLTSSSTLRAAGRAAGVAPGSITLDGSEDPSGTTLTITATAPGAAAAVAAANQAALSVAGAERQSVASLAAAAQRQARLVSNEISTVQSQIVATNKRQRTALQTQLTVDQAQYQQLYRAYSSYELAAATIAPGPAAVRPSGTLRTSPERTLLIALIIALVIGFALALARDHLSDRIQERDEVGDDQLPLLAEVPSAGKARPPSEVVSDSASAFAESIRELRTSLRFLRTERPLRVLMVTSPSSGEGKSFIAAHLAAATAAAGSTTVLLSTDLRRPAIDSYFELGPTEQTLSGMLAEASGRGLLHSDRPVQELDSHLAEGGRHADAGVEVGDLFPVGGEGRVDLSRLLASTELPNLRVIPSGPRPPNPSELLGSWAMGDLMDQLRDSADIVVVDSPPALAVTDTLVVSAYVDGVVLVVSRTRTSRQAITEALQRLRRGPAPVLGSVLNRGRPSSGSYLYLTSGRASTGVSSERT
jgi:succinoglycan biosynthesis transport protein ExoP